MDIILANIGQQTGAIVVDEVPTCYLVKIIHLLP